MKKFIPIFMALTLIGCSTPSPQIVKVPVEVNAQNVQVPNKPHLAIADLEPGMKPKQVLKAWIKTTYDLNNWGQDCHDLLVAEQN